MPEALAHNKFDVIFLGGGAAGFFGAISMSELTTKKLKIAIIESTSGVLKKVKVSGGGRCNVTNSCFNPKELIANYPRGGRKLLNSFFNFGPKEMIQWLDEHAIKTKTEKDGRVFPLSNSSQTIIDCFIREIKRHDIHLITGTKVRSIKYLNEKSDGRYELASNSEVFHTSNLVITTGSSSSGHTLIKSLGHTLTDIAPSLFTFKISHPIIQDLSGLSSEVKATIKINKKKLQNSGPLLITHWGLSGPCILKLSSIAARELQELGYKSDLQINWCGDTNQNEVYNNLLEAKKVSALKLVFNCPYKNIPNRLWQSILKFLKVENSPMAEVSNKTLNKVSELLTNTVFQIKGKSVFKEEFVTCGGVNPKEVNYKNFESKIRPKLFFAGEVLDVDAITGGFNFQHAWSSSRLLAQSIANSYN